MRVVSRSDDLLVLAHRPVFVPVAAAIEPHQRNAAAIREWLVACGSDA